MNAVAKIWRVWERLPHVCNLGCRNLTVEQVREYRKGFLMYTDTVVRNIAFQGMGKRVCPYQAIVCGGGVFETPGCVHDHCEFDRLITGDGKPVSNVRIENVRLNDYLHDPERYSRFAVWTAQTTHSQSPTRNIVVKNLVAMHLRDGGIIFNGYVQNALVDDTYIESTDGDVYAVWGGNFSSKDIVFQNSVARGGVGHPDVPYGICVAVRGGKEATFRNLECYADPWSYFTSDCYAPGLCNECLGVIKSSFKLHNPEAPPLDDEDKFDYSNSVFTFTGNKWNKLAFWGEWEAPGQVLKTEMIVDSGRPEVCSEWTGGGLIIKTTENGAHSEPDPVLAPVGPVVVPVPVPVHDVESSWPYGYKCYSKLNCYAGHGADELDNIHLHQGGNLYDCAYSCTLRGDDCHGFVFMRSQRKCWRRRNISLPQCERGYDFSESGQFMTCVTTLK